MLSLLCRRNHAYHSLRAGIEEFRRAPVVRGRRLTATGQACAPSLGDQSRAVERVARVAKVSNVREATVLPLEKDEVGRLGRRASWIASQERWMAVDEAQR